MSVAVLVRRCAWCDRVYGPKGWHTPGEQPPPDRETATICPDCVAIYNRHAHAS